MEHQTTITSGQNQELYRLLKAKGVTPEHFTQILSSGILADVFDRKADLARRPEWRIALGINRQPRVGLWAPKEARFFETEVEIDERLSWCAAFSQMYRALGAAPTDLFSDRFEKPYPRGTKIRQCPLVFVSHCSLNPATAEKLGKDNGYRFATPREVFALLHQKLRLVREQLGAPNEHCLIIKEERAWGRAWTFGPKRTTHGFLILKPFVPDPNERVETCFSTCSYRMEYFYWVFTPKEA